MGVFEIITDVFLFLLAVGAMVTLLGWLVSVGLSIAVIIKEKWDEVRDCYGN